MTTAAGTEPLPRRRVSALARAWAFARHHTLTVVGILALAYLMLPIVVVIVFSFNDPAGRFNYTWEGFTTAHWTNPFGPPFLGDSVATSIKVAVLATIVSVILGTLVALALVRYHFRGRGTTNLLIFVPAHGARDRPRRLPPRALPEPGNRARLLDDRGRPHHVLHQLRRRDRAGAAGRLRPARGGGRDGSGRERVRDVLPHHVAADRPGILAGALLAFSLSIDDFVITSFNSGTTETFPLYVWSQAQRGVPPEVNVIGTMIFGVAIVLMLANILFQWRRAPKGAV